MLCQKQISTGRVYLVVSVGCNYLSLPLTSASGTTLVICPCCQHDESHDHAFFADLKLKIVYYNDDTMSEAMFYPVLSSPRCFLAFTTRTTSSAVGASLTMTTFSLICVWTNGWVNNRDAGDLKRHRAHYDVTVMNGIIPLRSMNQISRCRRSQLPYGPSLGSPQNESESWHENYMTKETFRPSFTNMDYVKFQNG